MVYYFSCPREQARAGHREEQDVSSTTAQPLPFL